jgi:hypothetical protein
MWRLNPSNVLLQIKKKLSKNLTKTNVQITMIKDNKQQKYKT